MSRRFYANAFVYFIRPVGMDGPVKIGVSTLPERRLLDYHATSPFPLEIVAKIRGDVALERRFHDRFDALRTHHEWFRPDPDLTAVIDAIQSGTFDPEKDLPPTRKRARNLSPLVLANQSLVMRLAAKTDMIGLNAPDHVVEAARALYAASEEERAARVAAIEEYLSDPLRYGTPSPYGARKLDAYKARLAKQAAKARRKKAA